MTTHELARKLLDGPDVMAVVRGYEGGMDTITVVSEPKVLALNVHPDQWYYGDHEFVEEDFEPASDAEMVPAVEVG